MTYMMRKCTIVPNRELGIGCSQVHQFKTDTRECSSLPPVVSATFGVRFHLQAFPLLVSSRDRGELWGCSFQDHHILTPQCLLRPQTLPSLTRASQ